MTDSKGARWLIAVLLCLFAASHVFQSSAISGLASPQAGGMVSPMLRAMILSDGWPIKKIISTPSGNMAFAGGDNAGGADSLTLVAPQYIKIAAYGDPVPGIDGSIISFGRTSATGYSGEFSLNDQGQLAFTANLIKGLMPTPIEGLFLFSALDKISIALREDPAPETGGGSFKSFSHVLLNNSGSVSFESIIKTTDANEKTGLFLFSGGRINKVLLSGDDTPYGKIFLDHAISLDDMGVLTFVGSVNYKYLQRAIFQYRDGVLSKLLTSVDILPGGDVLGYFFEDGSNSRGDLILHDFQNLYFRGSDGGFSKILQDGDSTPIGGTFVLYERTSHAGSIYALFPKINDSGEALFTSLVKTSAKRIQGIFQSSHGKMRKIAADGDPISGGLHLNVYSDPRILPKFLLSNTGMTAFSAPIIEFSNSPGLFLFGNDKLVNLAIPGDTAPGTDGESFSAINPDEFSLSDSGEVFFHASVCCGKMKEGIFSAVFPHPDIPNGNFEMPGDGVMPASWQIVWTNFGSGEAFYSSGTDAWEGNSYLRLHVHPGGGAIYNLSDPISVSPDSLYMINSRMRYNLASTQDATYFTAIQLDNKYNEIAIDEVTGIKRDNYWTWAPKGLLIQTAPNASYIRIRFGLVSNSESYLDVDAVR